MTSLSSSALNSSTYMLVLRFYPVIARLLATVALLPFGMCAVASRLADLYLW